MSGITLTHSKIKSEAADLYKMGMRRVRQGNLQDAMWYLGRIDTFCKITSTRTPGPLYALNDKITDLSIKLYNALQQAKQEEG